eukprot:350505-Chlamydomonas_euryale.AAC.2
MALSGGEDAVVASGCFRSHRESPPRCVRFRPFPQAPAPCTCPSEGSFARGRLRLCTQRWDGTLRPRAGVWVVWVATCPQGSLVRPLPTDTSDSRMRVQTRHGKCVVAGGSSACHRHQTLAFRGRRRSVTAVRVGSP